VLILCECFGDAVPSEDHNDRDGLDGSHPRVQIFL
jgi:hypothetical protein